MTKRKEQARRTRKAIVESALTDLSPERMAVYFNRSARSVFLDWCISDAAFDLVKEGVTFLEEWILPTLKSRHAGSENLTNAKSGDTVALQEFQQTNGFG